MKKMMNTLYLNTLMNTVWNEYCIIYTLQSDIEIVERTTAVSILYEVIFTLPYSLHALLTSVLKSCYIGCNICDRQIELEYICENNSCIS